MKNRLIYSGLVLLAVIYNPGAMADSCPVITGPNPWVITPSSPLNYSGPQDGVPHGSLIGPGFSGVQLWASMSDSPNPANTTDTLSLTPDLVAQGVGIQFFVKDSPTPVTFGPASSSKGLPNAFFIDNSSGDGSIIEFPIVANYIQTGRLAPRSAEGIAAVTFSYQ